MPKGIFLVIPALFVDGLQILLSIGLVPIFAAPGALPVIGPALASVSVPAGILLGFALSFAISITFGAGILTLLALNDMFYPRYLVSSFGEIMPAINNLPFWTALVLLSVFRKSREEHEAEQAEEYATA